MLSLIRKNASSIWVKGGLFVVASTFLFFFGMTDVINKITGNDYIIKIGNVKIGPTLFKFEARKQAEKLKKVGITDETQIMNIVLSRMIDEELTKQMIHKYGIMVDDNLVKMYMYSIPMFRDKNGFLDKGAIRAFMSNMEIHENEFINFLRRDIQSSILGVPFSMCAPKVLRAAYIKSAFEKRNAKYVFIPYNSFSVKQAYTDEDLEKCLKNNADKFLVDEKRDFEVLTITEDDIMRDIKISDDAIAEEYKMRSESKSLENVKDSIRADLAKAEFEAKLNELIRNIEDDFSAALSCDEIAKKYNLKKADFKGITKNYNSPSNSTTALPAELMQLVLKTAFSLEVGQESSFFEGLDRNSKKVQLLVHTSVIVPAHSKPLAEVRRDVIKIWTKEKQQEAAVAHINGICDTINSGVAIDFIAEKYNYELNKINDVQRSDKASDAKFKKAKLISANLLAKVCQTSALHSNYVIADDGIVLFEVMSVSDEKDIDKEKGAKISQRFSQEYAQDLFQQLKLYNKRIIGVKINNKLLHNNSNMPITDVDF